MNHTSKTIFAFTVVSLILFVVGSASADIVDVPFGVVNVAGEDYYLNFTYYDGPSANHTFDGLDLKITFTTQATAEAARQSIIDMYLPNDLPIIPGMAYQGFYIPYAADATHFSYVIAHDGWSDNVWDDPWDFGHNDNAGRKDTIVVAAAEFTVVPLPPAVLLLGPALVGLVGRRKIFKNR